jgi:hypothetical protein
MTKPKATIKAINPRTFFSWEVRAIRMKYHHRFQVPFPTEETGGTKALIISKVMDSKATYAKAGGFPGDSGVKNPFSSPNSG